MLEALASTRCICGTRADALRREGQTVMFVAVDGAAGGSASALPIRIKATTREAIDALHARGHARS